MKPLTIFTCILLVIVITLSSCKAKHCPAFDVEMEGYTPKNNKKKRGRQEGLWGK